MTNIPDRVIRMELISYFSLYPGTVTTTGEMAVRLSRDAEKVERQMEALAELSILKKTSDGKRTVFSYLPPISVKFGGGRNESDHRRIDLCKAAPPDLNGGNDDAKRKNLEVKEGEVVHVGDRWYDDVDSPLKAGVRAIHLDREKQGNGESVLDLAEFGRRVLELEGDGFY